jgi:hypothetical protein
LYFVFAVCALTKAAQHIKRMLASVTGPIYVLYTQNNGKYLGLFQLLEKFDPVMQDHISRVLKGKLVYHCCGKKS